MMEMDTNPLSTLTFIAAPAVLTNACSMLVLNTTNRLARVVDRTRILLEQMQRPDRPGWLIESHDDEMKKHRRRSILLVRTMALLYCSIGTFTAGAGLSLVAGVLKAAGREALFGPMVSLSFVFGAIGLVSLIGACICLFAEVRLAIVAIRLESEYVLHGRKLD